VAVDVLEALVVHEAMVLGRVRRAAAGSDGPGDERVDFLPAFAAQADACATGLPIRDWKKGSVVSMAWMVSPTIFMNAEFSPLNLSLNVKPSAEKKALDLFKSFTGKLRMIWFFIAFPGLRWDGQLVLQSYGGEGKTNGCVHTI
jgi:hypothetical protein